MAFSMLASLPALRVPDERGYRLGRVKMEAGKDGAPTPGLKALGPARTHWHRLFRDQPGAVVSIALA